MSFVVPCQNPVQYLDDYDICDSLRQEDCETSDIDTQQILHEFCPALCRCSKLNNINFYIHHRDYSKNTHKHRQHQHTNTQHVYIN